MPPQVKELERAVLGACMLEKEGLIAAMEILKPEHFYVEAHQNIFSSFLSLQTKSQPVDILTVSEELKSEGLIEKVGGAYFVTQLTNDVVEATNIIAHANIILEKFIAREMIRIGGQMIGEAYEERDNIKEVLATYEQELLAIGSKHMNQKILTMESVLLETIQQIEEWRKNDSTLTGVPTGFPSLNKYTRGWQPNDLIVLAARPSVGKTALALHIIEAAATAKVPVAMFSLEMKPIYLMLRMLAAKSEIMLHRLQTGRLDNDQMAFLYTDGIQKLAKHKIYFDDTVGLTTRTLMAKARRLKSKYNIGLLVVDYLQLMTNESAKNQNREQEISKISRTCKAVATELGIPVIALSQLSRDIEKRTGKKRQPQLSDLRESGAIEQDADVVIFLWGPEEDEIENDSSLADLRYARIAKQRNGFLAKLTLQFKNEIQKFCEIQEEKKQNGLPAGNWKKVTDEQF